MNAVEREQLRLSLLRYLGDNPTRFGFNAALLLQMARNEGHQVDKASVAAELQYLEDKQLVTLSEKTISPENRAYRITAAGRDLLAANE
jgi:DNA-binding HxlR family transcriptional regulator